ncbi:MAG: hypothetical protein IPH35_08235 [Rhodoferax sp.]|nr:hypothetical protein [Rhodoferax sp.]
MLAKLPDVLSDAQKRNRVKNLLTMDGQALVEYLLDSGVGLGGMGGAVVQYVTARHDDHIVGVRSGVGGWLKADAAAQGLAARSAGRVE